MADDIKTFPKQFEFEPVIENAEQLKPAKKFIVAGMGGSNLATGLIRVGIPEIELILHRDYGLPHWPASSFKDTLVIASSYSGNTEETLDAFAVAIKKKVNLAVLTAGGKILDLARKHNVPYIVMPGGIEPRSAVGYSIKSLLKLMGEEQALAELKSLSHILSVTKAEKEGKDLAEKLRGAAPVVYASLRNREIAYNWKIRLNETGKVPAFFNLFPELNHNEMNSYAAGEGTDHLSKQFRFIFIKDGDHPRIKLRMEILKELFEKKNLKVFEHTLTGKTIWEKIFSSIMVADWTSYYTATGNGLSAAEVPMVEEFKALLVKRGGEYAQ